MLRDLYGDLEEALLMTKWFVYTDQTYYPGSVIVEAETPEDAVRESGYVFGEFGDLPILVFPWDALALKLE